MHVAHFIHRYPPALGGAESYFARLSRHLAGRGEAVTVHTTNALALEAFWSKTAERLPSGEEQIDGVRVRRYPIRYFPGRRYVLKALSLLPSAKLQAFTLPCNPLVPALWTEMGRAAGIDIIHASAFPYAWPILCARRAARRLGVPFCLTPFLHLGDPSAKDDQTRRQYLGRGLRWLLREADCIFVQTGLEREAVLAQGVAADGIVLQGLGVEFTECTGGQRARADARWSLPAEALRIGHLANLSEEKGSCDLLRALGVLWDEGLKVRAVLAGPSMPNFERYWATVPAKHRAMVSRLGVVAEEEKADFYATLDLFALPSRSDSFGLVLLEAWANGVPCVGYCAGGVAEVIHHEEDGLLVSCGNVVELAAALRRLAEDAALRQRFGASGKARMARDHRWEPKLEMVRSVYQKFITSGGRRGA